MLQQSATLQSDAGLRQETTRSTFLRFRCLGFRGFRGGRRRTHQAPWVEAIGQNRIAVRVVLKPVIGAVWGFQFLQWP